MTGDYSMADRPLTEWKTGLCECCDDCHTFCYGFWCCPCMACSVSHEFGENKCLPLCDLITPTIFSTTGIPLVAPPAAVSLRAAMRNRYNIKGSLCRDILVSCCCNTCSWCQMYRELKERAKTPIIISVHSVPPPNYVHTQQPAVVVRR
ncbi:unnamed protein product [Ophioblennius macclurei]